MTNSACGWVDDSSSQDQAKKARADKGVSADCRVLCLAGLYLCLVEGMNPRVRSKRRRSQHTKAQMRTVCGFVFPCHIAACLAQCEDAPAAGGESDEPAQFSGKDMGGVSLRIFVRRMFLEERPLAARQAPDLACFAARRQTSAQMRTHLERMTNSARCWLYYSSSQEQAKKARADTGPDEDCLLDSFYVTLHARSLLPGARSRRRGGQTRRK